MTKRTQSIKSLRTDARNALATCGAWNLRLAARRATQFVEQRMADAGVSFARFGLMAEIASAPDDTVGALAEHMGLDQSTLSRTLRALEAEQLVEIATVESDQRKRMVWLTEKGARRLETALAAWRLAQDDLEQHLSVDLARQLAAETAAL